MTLPSSAPLVDPPQIAEHSASAGAASLDPGHAHETHLSPGLARGPADAVLVDLDEHVHARTAVAEAVRTAEGVQVVAMAARLDRALIGDALAAGAHAVVLAGGDPDALRDTVRARATASRAEDPDAVAEALVESVRVEAAPDPRQEIAARVRGVLDDRAIEVHLQPIVDLRTGHVVGAEALSRFEGDAGPGQWFADAAAVGLTVELERLAIELALAELDKLPDASFLSLNVSAETLAAGPLFPGAPRETTARIVVELIDDATPEELDVLVAALEGLRGLGVRVAVGLACAGIASLPEILRLDPHFLKLDRALIRGVDGDLGKRALVGALMAFADATGATVIAEGIETAGELEALRGVRVPYGQGFLLSRPQLIAEGAFDAGVALPAPGDGVLLVRDASARTLVLKGPAPAVQNPSAPAARWRSASDAVQGALVHLEEQIPEALVWVAHLDYAAKRWQVVDARRGETRGVEAGMFAALDASACYHVAAARAPGHVADATQVEVLADLDLVQLLGLRSLACAPVVLPSGIRVACVGAGMPVPAALGPAAQRAVLAAAQVLGDAFAALFGDRPLDEVAEQLRSIASTDWLTGLTTHQQLVATLKREWRTAQRSGLPCGVVMIDVLGLPALARTGGQARAELLLRTLARRIAQANDDAERPDLVGRVEETRFAVILPGQDDEFTRRFGDRLQHRLENGLGPAGGYVSVDTTMHDLAAAEDPTAVLRSGSAWDPPETAARAR